jgi:hypothetical protein
MSTTENRKRGFWGRYSTETEESMARDSAATKAATIWKTEPCGCRRIVIAEGQNYTVELVCIPRGTSPELRPRNLADIFCLDLHEFGLRETIAWVQAAQEAAAHRDEGTSICISVLGNTDKLNADEMWQISRELLPAGAMFHPWPSGCESFDEAFVALAQEITKSYGPMIMYDGDSVVEWSA